MRRGLYAVVISLLTTVFTLFYSVAAYAVETETEKKVKQVSTQVGIEGTHIVLAILAGLVTFIIAVIVIPKGVGTAKRYVPTPESNVTEHRIGAYSYSEDENGNVL